MKWININYKLIYYDNNKWKNLQREQFNNFK